MAIEIENDPMIGPERAEEGEEERLSGLLKRCRARIGPERPSLGQYLRLPMRVGKAVTQEEVAEAVGISRQWYASLENDRPVRASAAVLARTADVLMMDASERAALFRLGVPELRSASLTERSAAILDTFESLRRLTRPLWAATTEAEALTVVREQAMTLFAPDEAATYKRVGESRWDSVSTGDADAEDCARRYFALVRDRWGPAVIDDLHCYTLLAQPGEVLTRSERDALFPDVAEKARAGHAEVGWADVSMAIANIRSQHGFVGRLQVFHATPHTYSAIERAQLSTLGDLTSLALSGCVSSSCR